MANPKKETIYLDAEDDITAIIESIKGAKSSIVALVVPKRAETLTSLVNMKLLNRAAKTAKKQVVLITTHDSITKLAGLAGVYTAVSLKSKPAIPGIEDLSDVVDPEAPVGALTAEAVKTEDEKVSTLEELATEEDSKKKSKKKSGATAGVGTAAAKSKIKVPNFDAFKIKLGLGMLVLIMLPVLWFVGFRVLPTASIDISTNATNVPAEVNLISSLASTGLDEEAGVIPVVEEENKQQYSEEFQATGEKQVGERADGLMRVSNCRKDDAEVTIPAGTGFSSGGFTFISQVAVDLDEANFNGSGQCRSSGSHVRTISVVAQEPGDQYNLSSRSYTIAGFGSEVIAFGQDMSGGTNDVITVVTQQDIDSAVQRLGANRDDEAVRTQLRNTLSSAGLVPLEDSFNAEETESLSSAAVDEETDSGTVTSNVTYSMIGVRDSDALVFLKPVLDESAGELQIIDSGITTARFSSSVNAEGGYNLKISTLGVAGLVLNKDDVFEQIKDRPADEAASELRTRNGITQVEVSTSPFWNSAIPNNRDKVTITINGE